MSAIINSYVSQRGIVTVVVTDYARYQGARFNRHRLIYNALLYFVVAYFNVANQREVLAERMPDKSIVGENTTQVRMSFEHDAEQIKCFTLEPICGCPN